MFSGLRAIPHAFFAYFEQRDGFRLPPMTCRLSAAEEEILEWAETYVRAAFRCEFFVRLLWLLW